MKKSNFLDPLEKCELCEHKCKVNRLKGENGVCHVTLPVVASITLHPAPPQSYTVFVAGCNYKCLNCQNWTISQFPDNGIRQRGYLELTELAKECINRLDSVSARLIGADRIFFSGWEATIHLPYIEKVVSEARKINPRMKVNFDTNEYITEKSLECVLDFATSITYDLKAYQDEGHFALTGVFSKSVLRNAEYIGTHAWEKLWEYRILVIPKISEAEIRPLAEFMANVDASLPAAFWPSDPTSHRRIIPARAGISWIDVSTLQEIQKWKMSICLDIPIYRVRLLRQKTK